MKTEVEKLLDGIFYERSMNQYAVEGASNLLRLIIEEADTEMLKQEPFNCIEGVWCFLEKICADMKKTEGMIGEYIKLRAEANKHE